MRRKIGVCIYEVQVKGNYRQSGHKRVWDTFLSISGKGYSGGKSALMGCYTLWLSEGDLKKVQVGLDSGKRNFGSISALLEKFKHHKIEKRLI